VEHKYGVVVSWLRPKLNQEGVRCSNINLLCSKVGIISIFKCVHGGIFYKANTE
jgi:hypothetical protein